MVRTPSAISVFVTCDSTSVFEVKLVLLNPDTIYHTPEGLKLASTT